MKRFYLLLLMLIGAVALFGCTQTTTLEKPTNVTISGDIVTWTAVSGADSYIVVVNSTEHVVTTTTFDLSTLNLTAGTYTISVVAKKGTQVSLPTASISYVVQGSGLTLAAPIVNLTGNILTWVAVPNATGYQVIVNATVYTTTQTTFDLTTLNLVPGTYSVTVKATAGTTLSQASAPKSYTVISVENREVIYANLLKAVNPSYVPNMTSGDFENEFEYTQYVRMETMVNLYLDVSISEGMNPTNMVAMMSFMVELPMVFENPQPSLLKEEFDKLGAYGMSPQIFASFVLTLGNEALSIALEGMESDRVFYEQQLTSKTAEIGVAMTGSSFVSMVQALQVHVASEDQALFAQFLMDLPNLDISRIIWATRDFNSSFIWQYPSYLDQYYYGDETDAYIDLFIRIVTHAHQVSDVNFTNSIDSYYPNFFDPLWEVFYMTSDIAFYKERMKDIDTQVELIEMILDMLENESEHVRTIIEEVSTYIQTVYQAIPSTLIGDIEALLSSGELSIEEVLILKNEIVTILIETIPSESSFEIFYETLITLAGSVAGYSTTTLVGHADTLAQLQRSSTLLGLEFLLSVDLDTIEDVMGIVDGMVTPGYYDEYEEMYYEGSVNPTKVADLIVYVLTYLDNFLTEQDDLVTAINNIDENPMIIDFITFIVMVAKDQLEDEMEPADFLKVSALLDEVVIELPNYIAFYETIYQLDKTLIEHIITTEGAMLYEIATFIEATEKNPEMVLNFIEMMIDHLMDYRGLIRSDIDEAFITQWVSLMRLPMKGVVIGNDLDINVDAIFNDIKPHLIDVIMNGLLLEEAIMAEIDSVSGIYAQIMLWDVEFDLGLMIHVILSANDVIALKLTLIEDTIDIIIDDILGNSELQTLLSIDAQMLIEVRTNLLDGIAHIDSELERISAFDFANLTEQQRNDIYAFFEMFSGSEEPPMIVT